MGDDRPIQSMRYPWNIGSMATQNNLHIPDDLLSAVNEAAGGDGKTTDEIAADALRRYLAHRKLEELGKYGREQSLRLGYRREFVAHFYILARGWNRIWDTPLRCLDRRLTRYTPNRVNLFHSQEITSAKSITYAFDHASA